MSQSGNTPTPTRGVKVMLDKERRLRFTLRTVEAIKAEFGEAALSSGLGGEKLAKVLWYGLTHEDAELTVQQVEDMVDLENLTEVMAAMARAFGGKANVKVDAASPQTPAAASPSA